MSRLRLEVRGLGRGTNDPRDQPRLPRHALAHPGTSVVYYYDPIDCSRATVTISHDDPEVLGMIEVDLDPFIVRRSK